MNRITHIFNKKLLSFGLAVMLIVASMNVNGLVATATEEETVVVEDNTQDNVASIQIEEKASDTAEGPEEVAFEEIAANQTQEDTSEETGTKQEEESTQEKFSQEKSVIEGTAEEESKEEESVIEETTEESETEETTEEITEEEITEEETTEEETTEEETTEAQTDMLLMQMEAYTVKFIGFENQDLGEQLVNEGEDAVEPEVPEITGYEFSGWDTDFTNVTQDITVTAIYSAREYTITYHINSTTAAGELPAKQTLQYGSSIDLPDAALTDTDKIMIGWSQYKNPTGKENYVQKVYEFGEAFTMPAKDVTLYAVWTTSQEMDAYFFIRYDGTIPNEPNPFSESLYTKGIRITKNIKVAKFIFDQTGTAVISNLNALPTTQQIQMVWPDYNPDTQYPVWYVLKNEGIWHVDGIIKDKVKLSYDRNCPENEFNGSVPAGGTYFAEDRTAVSAIEGTRTDYTFIKWTTNPDGTGDSYQAGDEIVMKESITLYAQWESERRYTVSYLDYNDNVLSTEKYKYDETVKVPQNPTRAADKYGTYQFREWKLVSGTALKDGKCAGDAVYQAVYDLKAAEYTVTYLAKDGVTELQKQQYQYGDAVTQPEAPDLKGYTFKGYTFVSGTELENGKCAGDAVYQAVYEAISYTVSYYVDAASMNGGTSGLYTAKTFTVENIADNVNYNAGSVTLESYAVTGNYRMNGWYLGYDAAAGSYTDLVGIAKYDEDAFLKMFDADNKLNLYAYISVEASGNTPGGGDSSGGGDDGGSNTGIPATQVATYSTTLIDDEAAPLAAGVEADNMVINEEGVPLAAVPNTGDTTKNAWPFAAAGVLALAGAFVIRKKQQE